MKIWSTLPNAERHFTVHHAYVTDKVCSIKCVNQWGLNCDRRLMNGASINSFSVVFLLYKQTLSMAFCVCLASLYLCLGKQRKPILCQELFKKRPCEDRLVRLNKSKLSIKCLDVPTDFFFFCMFGHLCVCVARHSVCL